MRLSTRCLLRVSWSVVMPKRFAPGGPADHPNYVGFPAPIHPARLAAMADAASAERAMLRVCHSGLDVTELQWQVLATLRTAMTIDAAYFATADPESLLITGAVSEDPLITMAPLFLDNELGARDVNVFNELV